MTNTVTTYEIKNSNGLTGGAWSRSYETLAVAATEIANTMGWPEGAFIGPKMVDSVGDDGTEEIAWCVYPTAEERDADQDGAHAPRVVRIDAPAPVTAETITTKQIKTLHEEALAAGDYRQVDLCDLALAAHETADAEGGELRGPDGEIWTRTEAREACADAINAGQG